MPHTLSRADLARLEANLEQVRASLARACRQVGRPPEDVRLLAVVKRVPNEAVQALRDLGQVDLAENRVQALAQRPEALRATSRFHLIGPLQTNKIRPAVEGFCTFHALDRPRLADRLHQWLEESGRRWPVLLQVNLGEESQKHGVLLSELGDFARHVQQCDTLDVQGLMGMPPWADDPEEVRPLFRALRETSHRLREAGVLPPSATELSMGMSHDFKVAVQEGATVVRIGSALFEGLFAEEAEVG